MNVRSSTAYHFELKESWTFCARSVTRRFRFSVLRPDLISYGVWTAIILIAFAMIYALFVLGEASGIYNPVCIFEQIFIYAMIILYSVQRALIFVFIFVWFVYVTVEKIKEKNALRPEVEQTKPTGLFTISFFCHDLLYVPLRAGECCQSADSSG